MMAQLPGTNRKFFFVDKSLPFGASVSCSKFQQVSDGLRHVTEYLVKRAGCTGRIINYLDDFLFIALTADNCNRMVNIFIDMCNQIRFPVAMDKTEWATNSIIFLGIKLDGVRHLLMIPEDKRIKAMNWVQWLAGKNRATVHELQQLAEC